MLEHNNVLFQLKRINIIQLKLTEEVVGSKYIFENVALFVSPTVCIGHGIDRYLRLAPRHLECCGLLF